jgi:hypothetical protein
VRKWTRSDRPRDATDQKDGRISGLGLFRHEFPPCEAP